VDKYIGINFYRPKDIGQQQIAQTLMHTLLRNIRSLAVGAGAVALQPKAALRIPAKYMSGLSESIHEKRFTHRLPAIEAPQPMENHFSRTRKLTERKTMNFKIIIGVFLTIALADCSNREDPKAYLGHWKKAKYTHVVLEITDAGNNHYLLKQLNLLQGPGFPPRKTMATMKGGELLIGGNQPVSILKDGSLLYAGDEFVRQTDAEVTEMKKNPTWQRYNRP